MQVESSVSEEKKKSSRQLLSISAFGKLTGIDRKTLIFYDQIGLLKPAVRNNNGYRYYERTQVNELCLVLVLQELGMSLTQIIDIQSERSPEKIMSLFTQRSVLLDRRLRRLSGTKDMLQRRQEDFCELSQTPCGSVRFVKLDDRYYYANEVLSYRLTTEFDEVLEAFYEDSLKHDISQGYPISYFISQDSFIRGDLESACRIGFHICDAVFSNYMVPAGTYALMFHRGMFPRKAEQEKMISAIHRKKALVAGACIIDTVIDEVYTDKRQEFTYRLLVPVI